MQVEVRLFASLRKGRFRRQSMDLPGPASLRDLVRRLDIADEEVSLPLVNGQYAKPDRPLQAGDVVALFPAIAGG